MPLRGIVGIRHGALGLGILGRPLECTGGALGQFPLVVEQVVQEAVAPLRRRVGPGAFEAAGDGVATLASAEGILPAAPLLLDRCRFRLWPDVAGGRTCAVRLAERVTADDEG